MIRASSSWGCMLMLLSLTCIAQIDSTTQINKNIRPDNHAPIGIMGDHSHSKGEWMFSYRYMPMRMSGNLSGRNYISEDEMLTTYMVIPKEMRMSAHMIGIMYAPSDHMTLMFMTHYLHIDMDLKHKSLGNFNTSSKGLGDLSLSTIFKLYKDETRSFHGLISLSMPTGSLNQKDNTPIASNSQLPYPMQLGSGTFDPSIKITYIEYKDQTSWGGQLDYTMRLYDNIKGYRLGNVFNTSIWSNIILKDWISLSSRIQYRHLSKIKGSDDRLNAAMMPLSNTGNSGRNQVNVFIGSTVHSLKPSLKGLRLAFELGMPISQQVNGIQMEQKLMGTLGIQYTLKFAR